MSGENFVSTIEDQKRVYESPQLKVYGALRVLTQGGSTGVVENNANCVPPSKNRTGCAP